MMGERKDLEKLFPWLLPLGVVGVIGGVLLWFYAFVTPGFQGSAVSVGSAFFTSGVVLLVGFLLGQMAKGAEG